VGLHGILLAALSTRSDQWEGGDYNGEGESGSVSQLRCAKLIHVQQRGGFVYM
jgi:hypothetical protein